MVRTLYPLVIAILLAATVSPATAQSPKIMLVQSGADELLADLEFMLRLTSAEEQKQVKVLRDFFNDIFLPGIDRQQAVRMDVMLGNGPVRYRPWFPVSDLNKFRENLDQFGIKTRRRTPSLYQLSDAFEGWMRNRYQYAVVSSEKGDVPLNLQDPAKEIEELLSHGYDVGVEMTNEPGAMPARKNGFDEQIRNPLLDRIAQGEEESDELFQLRKLFAEQMVQELERIYVEAASARFGWITDQDQKLGRSDLVVEATPGTSFHKALELLGKEPSYFANVQRKPNSILSARLNHPLDESRQQRFQNLFAQMQKFLEKEVEQDDSRSAEQRTAAKKALGDLFQLLNEGAAAGLLDGFIESWPQQNGQHTVLLGVRTVNGKQVDDIIAQLPKTKPGRAIEEDVATVGDVTIHKVDLAFNKADKLQTFFSGDLSLYVGSSKEAIWVGFGQDSLPALKEAIGLIAGGKAEPSDTFLDFHMQLGPWIRLQDKLQEGVPQAPKKEPKRFRRDGENGEKSQVQIDLDRTELRKKALEAFGDGDDVISGKMRREQNRVLGEGVVQPGVLEFIGKLIADFSKENLEEEKP